MKFLKALSFVACGVMPVFGTTLTTSFSFDNGSLANGSSDSAIQGYMNSKLSGGASVVVSGAVASNSYDGDGHVIGPGNGSTSLTLGTSDGGTAHLSTKDLFITNIANSSTEIKMVFTGLSILNVSFDYEIFPDGTCATGHNCGSNWPDFTFDANGNVVFHTLATQPANHSHSPASGSSSTELAPQFLGQSGTINFASGVSTLEFLDWPATIGIDNLVITYDPHGPSTPIPEPVSFALAGTGLIGIYFLRRRKPGSTKIESRG
jgi:hypothetical protein